MGSLAYLALSYAWGEPIFSEHIHDIATGNSTRITSNLHAALQTLRRRDQDLYIWIDAVCIHQSSMLERNHQVKNMASIYRQASEVLVWLGQEDSGDIMSFFATLCPTSGEELTCTLYFDDMNVDEGRDADNIREALKFTASRRHRKKLILECNRAAIGAFFDMPWFTRVCVIQDFLLARDVIFFTGEEHTSLYFLQRAINVLFEHHDLLQKCHYDRVHGNWDKYLDAIRSARELIESRQMILPTKKRTSKSLYQCCRMLIDRSCSDKRDKVYAALGLAKDDLGITPDYKKSFDEVCIDFARRSIQSEDFSVLHYSDKSWLDDACSSSKPSFVPDLHAEHSRPLPAPLGGADSPSYEAGSLRQSAVYLSKPLTIDIRGVRVNVVGHLESFAEVITDLPFGRGSPFKTQFNEAYQRVHVIYNGTFGITGDLASKFASFKLAFWRTLHLGKCPRRNEVQYIAKTDFRFLDLADRTNITESLKNRVFFMIELGFIGLGPPWLEEQDTVVVFDGAETPFILRPFWNEDGIERWKVIGDCYLEGWMDGRYFKFEIADDTSHDASGPSESKRDGEPVEGNVLKNEFF